MSIDELVFNCPSCGAGIERRLKYVKLVVCPHCQSSLFLEDDAVRNAGKMSVLTKQTSIFELAQRFIYGEWSFVPLGHIRYDYKQGFWDEWWVLGNDGKGKWISIDEGDVAIEERLEERINVPAFSEISIGQELKINNESLIATEKNSCVLAGAEGELPIKIQPGERNDYIDFSGQNSLVCRVKYFPNRVECYRGKWIDVFELRRF